MPLTSRVRVVTLLFVLLLLELSLTAQTRRETRVEPESSFGSVAGHVYLGGSNAPARFVQVALQPVRIELSKPGETGKAATTAFTVYQTGLDGSYAIPHVSPGSYYVVVMQRGFFSPFSLFTPDELEHPNAEVQQRMASLLPLVTVRPNAAATLDLTLQRGASLSGTVRFDDGTPFSETSVSITHRGSDGKWTPLRIVESNVDTDGDGRWTLGGLPPGEYRVGVQLIMQERHRSSLLGENSMFFSRFDTTLTVWLGDTMRESQAKTVTLTENQAASGEDITIPVSKMHQVSGAIVDRGSGQPLNVGQVKVVFGDDKAELTTAPIDAESRTFTLPYVPEGEYKLQVDNPHTSRFEQPGSGESDPFGQNRKEIVLRSYAPGEMPLIVQGEMSGVTLAVDPKPAKVQ